jgi:thymidylate synthase
MIKTIFKNAEEAYNYQLNRILVYGVDFDNTKALFDVGFTIKNPMDNQITNKERNWSLEYAKAEWEWYKSGDRSIDKLGQIYGKIPPIWEKMADNNRNVNSNYGYQWQRNNQIDYVCAKLRQNNNTRQAAISIYDAKEWTSYQKDTPCTYAVQFTILDNKLNMSVLMRSNDIWYGFCNDQYQFSMLQELVANRLTIEIGIYYHFAHNLHLYNNIINKIK